MLKSVAPSLALKVILFLAPLCPICQDMTFDVRGLEVEFADAPVEFVGVFPNPSTRPAQIVEFGERYGLSMPLIPDSMGWAEQLGARWTPEAFVLDHEGTVLYQGRINDRYFAPGRRKSRTRSRDLQQALNDIMAGRAVQVPSTDAVGCPIEGVPMHPSKN